METTLNSHCTIETTSSTKMNNPIRSFGSSINGKYENQIHSYMFDHPPANFSNNDAYYQEKQIVHTLFNQQPTQSQLPYINQNHNQAQMLIINTMTPENQLNNMDINFKKSPLCEVQSNSPISIINSALKPSAPTETSSYTTLKFSEFTENDSNIENNIQSTHFTLSKHDNDNTQDHIYTESKQSINLGKRRRISIACDYCNKRKIRCDGLKPACSHCVRQKIDCTFNRESKKKRASNSATDGSDSINSKDDNSTEKRKPKAALKEKKSKPKSENLKTIQSQKTNLENTPSTLTSNPNTLFFLPNMSFDIQNQSTPLINVPTQYETHLINLYFEYFHPIFPLFHCKSFIENLEKHPAILFKSMCAIGCRYQALSDPNHGASAILNAGDQYYEQAKGLIDFHMDDSEPDVISALLLLSVYAAGSGRPIPASHFAGMGIRMAQTLRLNLETENDPFLNDIEFTFIEKEYRRRIWWLCFVLDTYTSSIEGCKSSMVITEHQVYLPISENIYQSCDSSFKGTFVSTEYQKSFMEKSLSFANSSPQELLAPHPFRNAIAFGVVLFRTFNKTLQCVNLQAAMSQSTTNFSKEIPTLTSFPPLSNASPQNISEMIAEITSELEHFLSSIPLSMRMENIQYFPANEGADSCWRLTTLYFIFYTCQIMLYRPILMQHIKNGGVSIPSNETHVYTICKTASSNMTSMIEKILPVNPYFHFLSPFTGFCIYQAGTIHALSCELEPKNIRSSFDKLCIHLLALEGLSKLWYSAAKMKVQFQTMIDRARASILSGTPYMMHTAFSGTSNSEKPSCDPTSFIDSNLKQNPVPLSMSSNYNTNQNANSTDSFLSSSTLIAHTPNTLYSTDGLTNASAEKLFTSKLLGTQMHNLSNNSSSYLLSINSDPLACNVLFHQNKSRQDPFIDHGMPTNNSLLNSASVHRILDRNSMPNNQIVSSASDLCDLLSPPVVSNTNLAAPSVTNKIHCFNSMLTELNSPLAVSQEVTASNITPITDIQYLNPHSQPSRQSCTLFSPVSSSLAMPNLGSISYPSENNIQQKGGVETLVLSNTQDIMSTVPSSSSTNNKSSHNILHGRSMEEVENGHIEKSENMLGWSLSTLDTQSTVLTSFKASSSNDTTISMAAHNTHSTVPEANIQSSISSHHCSPQNENSPINNVSLQSDVQENLFSMKFPGVQLGVVGPRATIPRPPLKINCMPELSETVPVSLNLFKNKSNLNTYHVTVPSTLNSQDNHTRSPFEFQNGSNTTTTHHGCEEENDTHDLCSPTVDDDGTCKELGKDNHVQLMDSSGSQVGNNDTDTLLFGLDNGWMDAYSFWPFLENQPPL